MVLPVVICSREGAAVVSRALRMLNCQKVLRARRR